MLPEERTRCGFPKEMDIPAEFRLDGPVVCDRILINGDLGNGKAPCGKCSPPCVCGRPEARGVGVKPARVMKLWVGPPEESDIVRLEDVNHR